MASIGAPSQRYLSPYEEFYCKRGELHKHRGFYIQATFRSSLTLARVGLALHRTLTKYPILASNLAKDSDGRYYYQPLRIALKDIVETMDPSLCLDDAGVVTEAFMKRTNQHRWTLYGDTPLMKLVLLGDHVIVAMFEHTIADGMAGRYFFEYFSLQLPLVSPDSYAGLDAIVFDPSQPYGTFSRPIDEFVHYPVPGDVVTIQRECPQDGERWTGRFPAEVPYSLAFKHIRLTAAEVQEVLTRCRRERVSLTVYVENVLAITLAKLSKNAYQSHCAAMSMRHFVPEESQERFIISVQASLGIREWYRGLDGFSWDRVRLAHNHLRSDANNPLLMQCMQGWVDFCDGDVDSPESFFDSGLNKPKADLVKISNLGCVQSAEITDMVFFQDVMAGSAEFMVNIVLTTSGGLNFICTYCDHKNKEEVEPLVAEFKSNLLHYVRL